MWQASDMSTYLIHILVHFLNLILLTNIQERTLHLFQIMIHQHPISRYYYLHIIDHMTTLSEDFIAQICFFIMCHDCLYNCYSKTVNVPFCQINTKVSLQCKIIINYMDCTFDLMCPCPYNLT